MTLVRPVSADLRSYFLKTQTFSIHENKKWQKYNQHNSIIHKDIFACLSSIRPDDGRSISRNVARLNILVHDMINLLYYNSIKY